ncbi:MAG: YkgJ family cysteine cluster protein [Flavobacteriaceae bacterium]|nr:YkgJ family cysteine cluster protein [Flavobacteriaceae bacterium]
MKNTLANLPEQAKQKKPQSKKYFSKIRKKKPKNLDVLMQTLHEKEFENTDCLECANCCKTTSPIVTDKDILRISKFLRLKEQQFISQYLQLDKDDGLYMYNQAPCPFLDEMDNKCIIYEVRPKACKEYPHTDRKNFHQITGLTLKNTEICPATFRIVEELKRRLPM